MQIREEICSAWMYRPYARREPRDTRSFFDHRWVLMKTVMGSMNGVRLQNIMGEATKKCRPLIGSIAMSGTNSGGRPMMKIEVADNRPFGRGRSFQSPCDLL